MTLGKTYYNDTDMLRMQRDAAARVRDMQNRAREATQDANGSAEPANSGWTTGPGRSRSFNSPPSQPGQAKQAYEQARGGRQERPGAQVSPAPYLPPQQQKHNETQVPPPGVAAPHRHPPAQETAQAPPGKKTTIVEDIVGSLRIDSDTLLIVGLILILINQKADFTLILALAYLLI